jgi:hypothetical protein
VKKLHFRIVFLISQLLVALIFLGCSSDFSKPGCGYDKQGDALDAQLTAQGYGHLSDYWPLETSQELTLLDNRKGSGLIRLAPCEKFEHPRIVLDTLYARLDRWRGQFPNREVTVEKIQGFV